MRSPGQNRGISDAGLTVSIQVGFRAMHGFRELTV